MKNFLKEYFKTFLFVIYIIICFIPFIVTICTGNPWWIIGMIFTIPALITPLI